MTDFRFAAAGTALAPPHVVVDPPAIIVGLSPAMERLRRDVLRAAARNQPTLVVGEAGSGKSLVARALHEQGPRTDQCCTVVACQALPEALLDLELFGCGPGGSILTTRHQPGVLAMSSGGTVILENIDATGTRTQAQLAHSLAGGQPSGAMIEARLVATCTIDGSASTRSHLEIASRLGATLIHVPSLRERRSDIPSLAGYFTDACASEHPRVVFSRAAVTALTAYSWPGNVRQLKTVVHRLVATACAEEIQPNELPVGIRPRPEGAAATRSHLPSVGEELLARVQASGESFWATVYPLFMKREITRADLRDLVRRALDAARGNADELLRILNMPRSDGQRFLRFLRKYGCEFIS